MMTRQELYQSALRTVCARRQTAKANAQDVRADVLASVPGFLEAETAFRQAGVKATLAAASGGDSSAALSELQTAKERCGKLLKESGRAADCLEPKYTCSICHDTGSADGHVCTCVQALMRRMRREEIEKTSSLSVSSFDTLDLQYYPEQRDALTGWNVRHHMESILSDLRSYAEEFDRDSSNLLLIGNAGLGKTHTALAIAGIVLDKGFDVIYMSSPELFSQLEAAHFGNDRSGSEGVLMSAVSEADLLILDDLGSEMVTTYMLSVFYTLLNNRMAAHRPTIFTSNITDGTLFEKRYTEKISSRLAGSCERCVFIGSDIRQIKRDE